MDWIEKIIDEYMSCKCQAKPKGSVETADQIRKHIEEELEGMKPVIMPDEQGYEENQYYRLAIDDVKTRLIGDSDDQ